MNTKDIEREFQEVACRGLHLMPQGVGRYRVLTPFEFDDGDLLSLVLKQEGDRWVLSDGGNTFMRLSYSLDDQALQGATRQKIISEALSGFDVEDRGGELIRAVEDEEYTHTLYSFIQALLREPGNVADPQERVRSAFLDDLADLVRRTVPEGRRIHDWHDPDRDPHAHYPVDWYIEGERAPLLVFAVTSPGKAKDATIALLQFERWGMDFHSLGIFQDADAVGQKNLLRFADAAEKVFSSLEGNEASIERFIRRNALPAGT
jgi:hypothetical protein